MKTFEELLLKGTIDTQEELELFLSNGVKVVATQSGDCKIAKLRTKVFNSRLNCKAEVFAIIEPDGKFTNIDNNKIFFYENNQRIEFYSEFFTNYRESIYLKDRMIAVGETILASELLSSTSSEMTAQELIDAGIVTDFIDAGTNGYLTNVQVNVVTEPVHIVKDDAIIKILYVNILRNVGADTK